MTPKEIADELMNVVLELADDPGPAIGNDTVARHRRIYIRALASGAILRLRAEVLKHTPADESET